MKCPRCSSLQLRKTNGGENRITLFVRSLVAAVQCYRCGHVFYRPSVLTEDLPPTAQYRTLRRAA
jgi:hypothetical protein